MMAEAGASSPSVYGLFANALSQCRGQGADALLDNLDGLALQLADVCNERADAAAEEEGVAAGMGTGALLRRIQQHSDGLAIGFLEGYEEEEEDAGAWQLEAQTWRLVHALHAERMQRRQDEELKQKPSTSKSPYQTPFAAVQDVIDASAAVAELKIIRDWLSSNLACAYPVEVRKGYWPYTKNRLRSEKRLGTSGRTGNVVSSGASRLASGKQVQASKGVKALDPDAVSREASTLELEDAMYEKALNRTLFEYARGGQLDAAIDLSRQADRHWRAASLRGANLYWRPGLSDDMEGLSSPMGNRNRALWKSVCRAICTKSSVDEYERALYGALCGDLKSVLAVSTTWEAHLWAHANARLEASIDSKLDKSGSWWSQDARTAFGINSKDLGAVQLTELSLLRNVPSDKAVDKASEGDAPLAVELRDVFVKLSQTEQNAVNQQANHPFRIVQRALILSELPALFTHIESLLPSMKVTVSLPQYARLVRFFAHLILYLRLLRWDKMPTDIVCNSILKAYVAILEESGEHELVALYASSLEPESATESYAHYLKTMDINERYETKQAALLRAEKHDLDVAAVAISAVTMIFDEIFPSLMPTFTTPKTLLAEISVDLSPGEERLVRAIDWLCIHESTHVDAIIHANTLMRLFLNNGRLNAARTLLFDQLPSEVVAKVGLLEAEGDVNLQALEFIHWRSFFEALAQHMRFVEVWSKRPADAASRIDRHNWIKGLDAIVSQAQAAIEDVLQMDWLKLSSGLGPRNGDIQTEQRLVQVARIRQIYIPELIFRLHAMLFESRDVLPRALASVIRLPMLVADERHKLYLDFVTEGENRLVAYLEMVRQAELASLERQQDPFRLASADE